MISFGSVFEAVLPVYLVVLIGVCIHRFKVITPDLERGMMKVVFNIFYPCLILDKIFSSELVRSPSVVGAGFSLGFGILLLSLGVSFLAAKLIGLPRGGGMRSMTLSASVQNFGYVAVPVVIALFENSADVLGVMFVHNLGVEACVWTVGLMILTGKWMKSPRMLLNGPILSVICGLVIVYLGLDRFFPEESSTSKFHVGVTVRTVIHWFGLCAFPVALLLIGAMISDLVGRERFNIRVAFLALALRLMILPLLILSCAKFLPLAEELRAMLVVQAAMPSALVPIMIARLYGGHPQTAVQVVLVTSVGALITMPLIIKWGLLWVGL